MLLGSSTILALVVLTLGAACSLKDIRISLAASLVALAIVLATAVSTPQLFMYVLLIIAVGVLAVFSMNVRENQMSGIDYALVALIAVITVYIAYTSDIAFILASFVIASVPTYALVFVSTDGKPHVDVAIKYITFMVLATVLFIIGTLLLVFSNSANNSILYTLGFVMLILGLGMEVGCAPVHEWVPDVFSAADPLPLSVIASITKIVPFIAAYKILLLTALPQLNNLTVFVAFIAVISMFTGNIGALTAKETGRILAYSTVANMGYIIATLAVITTKNFLYLAFAGALLQLIVNAFGKLSFFASIKTNGSSRPLMYLLALSFIGLPPLMGFWSKFFILTSLVGAGLVWLAFLLIVNSAISIPYYLRIARNLTSNTIPGKVTAISLVASAAMLMTVLPPNWFINVAKIVIGGV
jgi:NADH-quinone oxidoreductase subunit N